MAPAVIARLAWQARSFLSSLPETSDITTRSIPLSSYDTSVGGSPLGPLAARSILVARNGDQPDPHRGALDPNDINNRGIFALFGIIGASMIIAIIWFFFWAKNGGFYFKEKDWDDYKTTVLRRRGPNGTLLSGATPSTNLGGGSVYKDVDDATTTITDSTGLSGVTAGASDLAGRERRKKKLERKKREQREKRDKSGRHVGEDGVLIDEDAEREAQQHLRSYRHERPARVGGLNKESEGSNWDGSTNPTESTASSDLLSNRERTPTSTPTKAGGIRKVYSTTDRDQDRIRAEAKRLQEKGRAAGAGSSRRDFSFQHAESAVAESNVGRREPERLLPGAWNQSDLGSYEESDLGTKSYHHVIPGLTPSVPSAASTVMSSEYAEDKRKRRQAGYRRNRE